MSVMTLGTTLCMVAFWISVNDAEGKSPWRWAFFVGVAVGLLSKGPVATVLTGIALTLWLGAVALLAGSVRSPLQRVWTRLPWVRGSLLAAALTLPWYLLAESRTPGFLNYFIMGEHVQRFLVSGWTGDLYGQGHAEARGTILWFALLGWMPWPVVALAAAGLGLWLRPGTQPAQQPGQGLATGEGAYLLAWVLAPLLFFTLSRNILPSYILPGLPAFGLLVALLGLRLGTLRSWAHGLWLACLVVPCVICAGLALYPGFMNDRSQRSLLEHWTPGEPLVYIEGRPLSADFYSRGQAVLADKPVERARWLMGTGLKDGKPVTLVMERPVYEQLSPEQRLGWRVVAEHGGFVMLRR
jgi:4-amino-4-deoxy-L-arabinose transferase-like glycosyltransferase